VRLAREVGSRFPTTHWSVVVAAGQEPSIESREALAALCTTYWYPLYAYVRRNGYAAPDAQDLTQGFFAVLLEKGYVRAADRDRGRFRTFLLTALKRYMVKERAKARARKRGGRRGPISLDLHSAEKRYALEPAHNWTPERVYERRWALTLLDQAIAQLRQAYAASGRAPLFDHLKAYLTMGTGSPSYRQAASELGMTEGAVKVAVHRLRRRHRELLRSAIADTVADPQDVDDELEILFRALRGDGPRRLCNFAEGARKQR
jgi:RNA polymerase sigma-70 factor (ECF subfamily)